MLNRVTLIGNLGKDPEIRHLEGGATVGKFPIATNESYKDKSGEWQTITEWHDIVVWRQLAERAERDLKKGMLVYIEGKLRKRKYQDKDGIDRYVVEVVANTVRLLEKRESRDEGSFPSSEDQAGQKALNEDAAVFDVKDPNEAKNISSGSEIEDDLPF
jgi:single-strand DNA-binding protein